MSPEGPSNPADVYIDRLRQAKELPVRGMSRQDVVQLFGQATQRRRADFLTPVVDLSSRAIPHADQLAIQGFSDAEVRALFGKPKETRRSDFQVPYFDTRKLPAFEEEWFYSFGHDPITVHVLLMKKRAVWALMVEPW